MSHPFSDEEISSWSDMGRRVADADLPATVEARQEDRDWIWIVFRREFGDDRPGWVRLEEGEDSGIAVYMNPHHRRPMAVDLVGHDEAILVAPFGRETRLYDLIGAVAGRVKEGGIAQEEAGALLLAHAHTVLPAIVDAMRGANAAAAGEDLTARRLLANRAVGLQEAFALLVEQARRCFDERVPWAEAWDEHMKAIRGRAR